ncbi:CHASE2 domain-containing protein [Marinomonas atlantica]|uniref:CHASE2 domain-containing protein n=1 Tax=Marinomonas atlantica TaxID=1806668 RepID=UPI00082E2008|nr:CHASE2 domain-containing protein [Marinomonas atlantica]
MGKERLFLIAKWLCDVALSLNRRLRTNASSLIEWLRPALTPAIEWLRFAALPLIKALTISSIILINPLGLKTTSQNQSEMLILDATASNFEADSKVATVILIDDYTIEKHGYSYPIGYRALSRILKTITYYNPKSVFIDIFQHYEHTPNLDNWLTQLEISSKEFPIFIGSDPDFDTEKRLNNEDSLRNKINKNTTLSPIIWRGLSKNYPLFITPDTKKEITPTASMLMYKYYCETHTCSINPNIEEYKFYDPMIVRWNNTIHEDQSKFISTKCKPRNNSFFKALDRHFTYGFRTSEEISEKRDVCSPILTILADSLLEQGALDNPALKNALKDKFIFIGYKLSGSSDVVISPVHDELPGVFFHAMSFINLVTMGDNYWKKSKPIDGYAFSYIDLYQNTLYFLALFLSFYMKNKVNNFRKIHIGKKFTTIYLLILATTIYLILSKKTGPLDWIAFTGVFFLCLSSFITPAIYTIKNRTSKRK